MNTTVPRSALAAALLFAIPARAPADELTLADHGRSVVRIVVPSDRTPALDYAATELQRLLAEISGATLPIADEKETRDGPALLLGPSAEVRATGLVEEAKQLGPDGVLLKTVGNDVVLLGGGERGQIYVVYELLERFLGCRFLARDCTVAPKRDLVTLPSIDRRYASPFEYRELLCFESSDCDHAMRLRLNGANTNQCLGRRNGTGERVPGILICPFVHSAESMVPSATYFATHPEYFGLVNGQRHGAGIGGQLCYSNPEVLQICKDWIVKWFTDHPDVSCVDVSQNDAYPGSSGACECERCSAVVHEEGSQHGPILRFVNAIAAEVAQRCPGKTVETIAYQHTLATPKVTKPRADVVIRLCQHACYFHGIDCKPLGAEFRDALDDWRTVAKRLYVWHYGVNFWSYIGPNPNLEALASDLKSYAKLGVNGVMVQGDLQSPGGELSELREYLCAQLLWDPARDPRVIRDEFCDGYYGPSKAEALAFLGLMDQWAATAPQHIPMNGWSPQDVTPPAFVAAALEILGRAFAKAPDAVHQNRVEKLMVPLWFLQLAWPDRFGLARENGAALLARFRRVLVANEITTISEGAPNAAAFVKQLESVYGSAKGGD